MTLSPQKFLGGQAAGGILAYNFDTHPIPTDFVDVDLNHI